LGGKPTFVGACLNGEVASIPAVRPSNGTDYPADISDSPKLS
jgi:hypothetical protein